MRSKPFNMPSFVAMASTWDLGYNEPGKALFHSWGKTALRKLAEEMGLPRGSYDIRSNMGGIAVSGEITLHGESIYVDLSQSALGKDAGFMARACNGRKDYTGKRNHWFKWAELLDLRTLAAKLRAIMEDRPYVASV